MNQVSTIISLVLSSSTMAAIELSSLKLQVLQPSYQCLLLGAGSGSFLLIEKRCGLMKLFALMSRGEISLGNSPTSPGLSACSAKPIGGLSLFSSVRVSWPEY